MKSKQIVISNSAKSFDFMLTILSSSQSLLIFSQCLLEIKNNDIKPQISIQPNVPIIIPRGKENEFLLYKPESIVKDLAKNIRPNEISFEIITNSKSIDYDTNGMVKAPDISFIRKPIIQGAFIQFYELNKPSNLFLSWTDNWKFAWLIRNAFAHGGKINWTDERIVNVRWDLFSFERVKDNGREIIFKDFAEADIIFLLTQLE